MVVYGLLSNYGNTWMTSFCCSFTEATTTARYDRLTTPVAHSTISDSDTLTAPLLLYKPLTYLLITSYTIVY